MKVCPAVTGGAYIKPRCRKRYTFCCTSLKNPHKDDKRLEDPMADDFLLDTDDLTRRMDGAMANLRTEFASLRTGRASASMLEPVMVDAYGSMTPLE